MATVWKTTRQGIWALIATLLIPPAGLLLATEFC